MTTFDSDLGILCRLGQAKRDVLVGWVTHPLSPIYNTRVIFGIERCIG